MTTKQPFFPHYGSNQVLTVTSTSAPYALGRVIKQVRVLNTGANIAYFRTYDGDNGAQAATVADYPVPPGVGAIVSKQGHNAIAVVSALGTTLQVMVGEGF